MATNRTTSTYRAQPMRGNAQPLGHFHFRGYLQDDQLWTAATAQICGATIPQSPTSLKNNFIDTATASYISYDSVLAIFTVILARKRSLIA